MVIDHFINNIILKISIDERVKDGIFKVKDKSHLSILKEYLLLEIKDISIVDEILKPLIDESEASELAHKKGWEFKGGYWWDSSGPIARTVDGKLKTLDQIEQEKNKKERDRELSKKREELEIEKEKLDAISKRQAEKSINQFKRGIDVNSNDSVDVVKTIQPKIDNQEIKSPEEHKETKSEKIAKIKSKVYQQLNKEGNEFRFISLIDESSQTIIGFLLENGEFVEPNSKEDPRFELSFETLKNENWLDFYNI